MLEHVKAGTRSSNSIAPVCHAAFCHLKWLNIVTCAVMLLRKREGGIREAAAAALQGAEVERSVQLSCGEHTDYGLLTLVNQDAHISALQVCYWYHL